MPSKSLRGCVGELGGLRVFLQTWKTGALVAGLSEKKYGLLPMQQK
jgi:hypothetical protein